MNDQELIRTLAECAAECENCAVRCCAEGGMEKCARLCMDCADLCAGSIAFVGRESETAEDILRLCGSLCESCAEECERFPDKEHCRRCAEACRRCAEACRSFAETHAG